MTLDELFLKHGSDKGALKNGEPKSCHEYGAFYEHKLNFLRNEPITILEIGLCNTDVGVPSLEAWKEWFPKAKIIGVDIRDFTHFSSDRVQIFVANQADNDAMGAIAEQVGPFDIVIDDGSHLYADIIASLKVILPYTKQFYFVEDVNPDKEDTMSFLQKNFPGVESFTTWEGPGREFVCCIEMQQLFSLRTQLS